MRTAHQYLMIRTGTTLDQGTEGNCVCMYTVHCRVIVDNKCEFQHFRNFKIPWSRKWLQKSPFLVLGGAQRLREERVAGSGSVWERGVGGR